MSADFDWTTDLGDAEVNQPRTSPKSSRTFAPRRKRLGHLRRRISRPSSELRRARLQGPARLRGLRRRKPGRARSPSSRRIRRLSMSRLMIRPPSTSLFRRRASSGLRGRHRCRGAVEQQPLELANGRDASANLGRLPAGVATTTTATSTSQQGGLGGATETYRPGMGSKPGTGAGRPGGVGRPGGLGGIGGVGRPGGIGGPGGLGGRGGIGGADRPGERVGSVGPGEVGGPGARRRRSRESSEHTPSGRPSGGARPATRRANRPPGGRI